jgi:hypothetical protein
MQDYSSADSSAIAVAMAFFAAIMIPIIIIYVVTVIGYWKVFEKAGKPGWAAIIPIYNIIVLLEIVGKPTWWVILILFPCTSFIFAIWLTNLLSKSFGQSEGFTIGLLLLPWLFYPILGFGSYKYIGPSAKEAGGLRPLDPSFGYKDPFNNTPPPPPTPPPAPPAPPSPEA